MQLWLRRVTSALGRSYSVGGNLKLQADLVVKVDRPSFSFTVNTGRIVAFRSRALHVCLMVEGRSTSRAETLK